MGKNRVLYPLLRILPAVASVAGCSPGEDGNIDLLPGGDAPGNAGSTICADDTGCAPPRPYCEPSQHVCVQCIGDGNCGPKICDLRTFSCVACVTSADCGDKTPYCSASRCVACLSTANCGGPDQVCNTREGKCVPRCTADTDCSERARPVCSAVEELCVECRTDADCAGPKPRCAGSSCVACLVDADCGETDPYCRSDGQCVECRTDADCPELSICDGKTCKG